MKHLLLAAALIASPAYSQTTNGLTDAQKAQVADPNNPQFAPIPQYAFPIEDKNAPSAATKTWALKRAYQLNGNSMVGGTSMVDLGGEIPFANQVKTDRIAPAPETSVEKPVDKPVRKAELADTCSRHGLHRITTRGGRSWRCK